MKIGVFDPYLDSFGGGERYMMTIASFLSVNHEVTLFWNKKNILRKIHQRLNIDTTHITIQPHIFSQFSFLQKIKLTSQYDLFFYLSDGSVPWLFAKKNLLLFQFPIPWVQGKDPWTKLKLLKIHKIISNSHYVARYIDKTFGLKSSILYPPVDSIPPTKKQKENIILTVGRFTRGMNMKKQEILIDAFKKLYDKGLKGWKFILLGGMLPKDKNFVESLRKESEGYPIELYENASHKEIVDFYQKAKIYWHGAGIDEDLKQFPERAEHFGITTVEAMSTHAVPISFAGGGQTEIIENNKNGLLWKTQNELEEKTLLLINNSSLWQKISNAAYERSLSFTDDIFCKNLLEVIK